VHLWGRSIDALDKGGTDRPIRKVRKQIPLEMESASSHRTGRRYGEGVGNNPVGDIIDQPKKQRTLDTALRMADRCWSTDAIDAFQEGLVRVSPAYSNCLRNSANCCLRSPTSFCNVPTASSNRLTRPSSAQGFDGETIRGKATSPTSILPESR
jgi:hypothetical protein